MDVRFRYLLASVLNRGNRTDVLQHNKDQELTKIELLRCIIEFYTHDLETFTLT